MNPLSLCVYQMNNATMVDITNPNTTGLKFFRTRSITGTPHSPATATSEDQAMMVPPPVQIDPICPIAASVDGSTEFEASAPDSVPVNGNPEKPDPSKPVIIPINKIPKADNTIFSGMTV